MTTSDLEGAIERLQADLTGRATEKSRRFWSRYLKGDAAFRGVPMGEIRKAVHDWWAAEGFQARAVAEQKAIALRLFDEDPTEDRLAGVLAFAEILLPELGTNDLPAFADLFGRERIADWNLCDWFCVKVLGSMVETAEDRRSLAEAIGAWRASEPLWQRRAAAVAFVNLVPKEGFGDVRQVALASCEALVRDSARFAQTGVGWVMRELSVAEPSRAIAFAEAHLERLSREAAKSLTKKLPADERERLLRLHAEA